jgi:hypothetical protein
MSTAKLLTLKQKKQWLELFNLLPVAVQDVYYTPDYYEIYEKHGDGQAGCFVYQEGKDVAIYPFLVNEINSLGYELDAACYDIQGAYGYNGVVYSTNAWEFIDRFYKEFDSFCKSNNIIAEFTRFHPIIKNEVFSHNYMEVMFNRTTVYVDLTKSYHDIYNKYKHSVKTNIKAAVRNDLKTCIYGNEFPYKKDFIEMYRASMEKLDADPYMYFSEEYFTNTMDKLPVVQFVILKDKEPIASSLCLLHGHYFHPHFLAYKAEYSYLRPVNILVDEMIKYGIEIGSRVFHFGGGRTTNKEDSLLRFKKNYSDLRGSFYVGKKVHDEAVYSEVCRQWEERNPLAAARQAGVLLRYRNFAADTESVKNEIADQVQ